MNKIALKCVVVFSLVVCLNQTSAQVKDEWKMKPITIQTRWAGNVNPNSPMSEYPRPQMVRNNWDNLNGIWKYLVSDKGAPMPTSFTENILVPYPIESSLSGVAKPLLPNQDLWYKRKFHVTKDLNRERLLLHFGAVDYSAVVYINGVKLGEHEGGYTEFSFDITQVIKEGENELLVKVNDPTEQGVGPHGKQVLNPANIYYTASSGIWQTVWLERVPYTYIQSLKITPDIDNDLVAVHVTVNDEKNPLEVEVWVKDEGKIVSKCKGRANQMQVLHIKQPRLWSPDNPYLYGLVIRIIKEGKVLDEVNSYIGMRKISLEKDERGFNRIFLNNKYYYNLGILDQGFWPESLYSAPSDSALEFDIKIIKSMGFNTIRKHIKVEPARWYYHADRIGILVWQDFVNPNQSLPDGAKVAFERQVKETMNQLYNYPSISTWVIFNEKWGQYDQKRITEWIKHNDSTRLVNGHSGELLYVNDVLRSPSSNPYEASDFIDIHSYPRPRDFPGERGKGKVLGEFGGIGVPIIGHLWDEFAVGWGYDGLTNISSLQTQFSNMIDSLKILEKNGLTASIYTQPFDVESEQNGLLSYDRAVIKMPVTVIRNINSRLWKPTQQDIIALSNINIEIANPNEENYDTLVNQFRHGTNDKVFLRQLARCAYKRHDNMLLDSVSNVYVAGIYAPYSKIDLKFLEYLCFDTNSAVFKYVVKNYKHIQKDSIIEETLIAKARRLLDEEVRQAVFANKENKKIDSIQAQFSLKYGLLAELVMWENLALYYLRESNMSKFVMYKQKIHDKYPRHIEIFDMNNDAWKVFQKAEEKDLLTIALAWSEKVLEKEPTGNYYDTYANILYKLGDKEQAIRIEQKALTLDTGNGAIDDIRNNLEKMKKGIPTWK